MIRKKAINKIFTTTIAMFIILTLYTIPHTQLSQRKVLRTNLEIEDISLLNTDNIYLLNKNNLLVRTEIFINSKKIKDKVAEIIKYLTINNSKIASNLKGYIPENVKLEEIIYNNKNLVLNFSEEFNNISNLEIVVTGIVHSLVELEEIDNVSIKVKNNYLKNYPEILNKDLGINKNYLYTNRNNIKKVVIYYLDENDNYIPVTKYLNDKREKIEIVIDELLNNNNPNLISLLNSNTELLSYKEESNVLFLNFNNHILNDNETIKNKILNTIAYSAFANYDINMVMFEINGKKLESIVNNNN